MITDCVPIIYFNFFVFVSFFVIYFMPAPILRERETKLIARSYELRHAGVSFEENGIVCLNCAVIEVVVKFDFGVMVWCFGDDDDGWPR
jgi:hypothetical protein